MNEPDRRKAFRAPRAFLVRYRPPTSSGAWLMSPLRDISGSGARFLSEYMKFRGGDVLEVQLVLPNVPQPLPVVAKVMWVKPGKLRGTVELGVAFEFTEELDKTAVTEAAEFFDRRK